MMIDNEHKINDESRTPEEKDFETCNIRNVTIFDLIWIISMIFQRLFNLGINTYLVLHYYQSGLKEYFIWTLSCMIISMVLITIIHFYIRTYENIGNFKIINCKYFEVLILVIIFRYTQSLYYSILCYRYEAKKNKSLHLEYYKKVFREEADLALLRTFECFLEVAPQTILQIAIAMLGQSIKWIQFCSIFQSLISLSWCMVTYHRYSRLSQADKEKISSKGIIFHILYHFCIATSRILSIAFILSVNKFRIFTLAGCLLHSLTWGFSIFFFLKPVFMSESTISLILFCGILGLVYIFVFIMPKEGNTKIPYTIYYTSSFLEIILLSYLFYGSSDLFDDNSETTIRSDIDVLLAILPALLYTLGIIIMVFYYIKLHPTRKTFPNNVITRSYDWNT